MVILTNATLARSNSALPDDDDYTETCWSCLNVNFNVNFKTVLIRHFNCASAGKHINFDRIKMHGTYVRGKKVTKKVLQNENSTKTSYKVLTNALQHSSQYSHWIIKFPTTEYGYYATQHSTKYSIWMTARN